MGRQIPARVVGKEKKRLEERNSLFDMDYEKGLDARFLEFSKSHKISIEYLEKVESKPEEWLKQFSYQDLEKLLAYPDPVGRIIYCFQSAMSGYRSGVLNQLDDYQKNCMTTYDRVSIDERSKQWQAKLQRLSQKGEGFIVVGVAHLVGENGLLNWFSEKGYDVERVSFYKEENTPVKRIGLPSRSVN
ncbi:MAG: TraB/GumN family protein [Bdellovibrionaceae bacterium]|nr:TraB/GumN family protein [Pseudobdellovibrionaceae bacterium]